MSPTKYPYLAFFASFQLFFPSGDFVTPRERYAIMSRLQMHPEMHLRPVYFDRYVECPNNICERHHGIYYPEDEVREALASKEWAFMKVLNRSMTFSVNLSSRGGFGEATETLCRGKSKTTTPLVMRNTDGHWKYIVNLSDQIHTQTFTSEICLAESDGNTVFCTALEGECAQQRQEVKFLVYEKKQLKFDSFRIPTACSCGCSAYASR
ncbi:uncharacterized protein LOC132702202 [Cylas formicarius]|uniref:uncharacterized protein LOC132702202 n=1 Tax=Cylas formicarius TaxID=197179 RepID=UPI00295898FE|nr:uncharacterized protein LOC132702202 [Cylas formicarius]